MEQPYCSSGLTLVFSRLGSFPHLEGPVPPRSQPDLGPGPCELCMTAAGVMVWFQALAEQDKRQGDRWKRQLLTHITLALGGLRN